MNEQLLRLDNLSLVRNGVPILDGVNLELVEGGFHVLLGANGSGKTTLIGAVSGVVPYSDYTGAIVHRGTPLRLAHPRDALLRGIVTMYQHPQLYENLSIAENIYPHTPFSSQEKFRYSKREKLRLARDLLGSLGVELDPAVPAGALTSSQKRMVELVRMSTFTPDLAIFDEPADGFAEQDVGLVVRILKSFRSRGVTIFYATHRFEEVQDMADKAFVLKDGSIVESVDLRKKRKDVSVRYKQSKRYPKLNVARGKELFCVEGLSFGGALRDISLTLHQGEIIGVTGLEDSGKSLLGRILFGLEPATTGAFYVDRLPAKVTSPQDAINLGIAYVTDERASQGLFWNLSAVSNVLIVDNLVSHEFFRSSSFENSQFKKYSHRLNLGAQTNASPAQLSGGEQQKLLLLRWIMSTSKIFILDKPTKSLDVASKIDTYNLINDLVNKRAGVIVISSDVEELMGICDTVLVMRKGEIVLRASRTDPASFARIQSFM